MIKSKMGKDETVNNDYPCLKKYIGGKDEINVSFVVLFSSRNVGVVVYVERNCNSYNLGEYSETWVESNFALINEPITLSNV